ncbi:MAG: TetR/AcrR family transcriptional regulator [Spirochaetaceae bacterium]|nr:TetR/AcrR family transcriptional regulator [Spirochaetaceae bacterium]MDT8299104.1 TetR/AcrR family transcriptional regulator [Spirochaetaceae bacterium]
MRTKRQREFMDAAMKLVAEKGFSGFTIRNVASAVGVTEPAVYRHFSNKLDLLTAMLEDLQAAIVPHFRKLSQDEGGAKSILGGFIHGIFDELKIHPSFAPFIFSEELFHAEPLLRPMMFRVMKENLSVLTDSLEILQNRKVCRKDTAAAELSVVIMGSIRMAISQWHLSNGTLDLSKLEEGLTETLFRLLQPASRVE